MQHRMSIAAAPHTLKGSRIRWMLVDDALAAASADTAMVSGGRPGTSLPAMRYQARMRLYITQAVTSVDICRLALRYHMQIVPHIIHYFMQRHWALLSFCIIHTVNIRTNKWLVCIAFSELHVTHCQQCVASDQHLPSRRRHHAQHRPARRYTAFQNAYMRRTRST